MMFQMNAKILIAEDEPVNRMIFSTVLKDEGYEVLTAENGLECVGIARREKPDVILMDIQMPVMNGFEALKILKQDAETKNIPVIIISANSEPSDMKFGFELGATEFLQKPINISELLIRVGTVLKIKKSESEVKKLRSEMIYLLIQDLKNTISVIKGTFELALKDKFGELSEEQKMILDIAETAIENHIKTLDEYLELSRLELNVDKLEKEMVEIGELVRKAVEKFSATLNIEFERYEEPLYVYGNEKYLVRLIEFIFNAISGVGARNVAIRLGRTETLCKISIHDKDTKIENNEAELLFDRYKQALLQKIPRYRDLGLTIARIIVEAHNGRIWAEPSETGGTFFFIEIPCR